MGLLLLPDREASLLPPAFPGPRRTPIPPEAHQQGPHCLCHSLLLCLQAPDLLSKLPQLLPRGDLQENTTVKWSLLGSLIYQAPGWGGGRNVFSISTMTSRSLGGHTAALNQCISQFTLQPLLLVQSRPTNGQSWKCDCFVLFFLFGFVRQCIYV